MSATRGKDARQRFAPTSTHRRLRGGRNYCHIAKHLHCSCGRNNTPISSPGRSCWPDLSDNVAPTCLRTHSRLPEQLAPSTPKMPMHQILTVSHPPPINMLVFVSLRETQIFSTLTISSILAQWLSWLEHRPTMIRLQVQSPPLQNTYKRQPMNT